MSYTNRRRSSRASAGFVARHPASLVLPSRHCRPALTAKQLALRRRREAPISPVQACRCPRSSRYGRSLWQCALNTRPTRAFGQEPRAQIRSTRCYWRASPIRPRSPDASSRCCGSPFHSIRPKSGCEFGCLKRRLSAVAFRRAVRWLLVSALLCRDKHVTATHACHLLLKVFRAASCTMSKVLHINENLAGAKSATRAAMRSELVRQDFRQSGGEREDWCLGAVLRVRSPCAARCWR